MSWLASAGSRSKRARRDLERDENERSRPDELGRRSLAGRLSAALAQQQVEFRRAAA